ncbi:hypothetical protein JL107_00075 [Nakamurella flavida]|uniref:Uncharacterized protein n=1 Tax=Nakamurella flavida TaxID=363630 RepID=A0A938YFB7_9ACTN|nr:hypothetical protein [Nakamurella flavida]MBM9474832.1 hypothetical protein [Nakamurella flavida]MDP9776402.1 hypothetical protein [Nakamurella flavida]
MHRLRPTRPRPTPAQPLRSASTLRHTSPRRTGLRAATGALAVLLTVAACGSSTQDQAGALAAALSSAASAGQASAAAAPTSTASDPAGAETGDPTTGELAGTPATTTLVGTTAPDPSTAAETTGSGTDSPGGTDDGQDGTGGGDGLAGMDEEMAAMSPECQGALNGFLAISPLLLGPITGGSVTQAEIDQAFAAADGVLPADLTDEAAVIRQAAQDSIGVDMSRAAEIIDDPAVTAAMDALSEGVDLRCGGG